MKRTRPDDPPAKPAPMSGRTWEDLIRPPRPRFTGFDRTRTDKLRPTGAAGRDKILSERLQPVKEEQ